MSKIKKLVQGIPFLDHLYTRFKWRERKVSYGEENPDKIFYVVRRATCKVGLFSYVMTDLGLIEDAMQKGCIPVVDLQNMHNTYLEEEQVGKKNAWEYYFEQPCGYDLADISKSKQVILSNGIVTKSAAYPDQDMLRAPEQLARWRNLSAKYLKVNPQIQKEAEDIYQRMFGEGRVLGVLARGTDYVQNMPHHHPIQPTVEELQIKLDEVSRKFDCQKIYLATEDDAIYQQLKKIYGDRLLVTGARRCTTEKDQNINDISSERANDRYLKGKEYLINILLLAQCNCLVAGNVNGSMAACLLTKGYEYQYIFDKGLYR